MTSIPVVLLPTFASLWQTSHTSLISLWLISTLLAQDSVWMHLLYFTLLIPSSSSFTIDVCSILSMYQISCGIWTALVWEQLMPSPLLLYIPMASIVITSFSLRFLPITFCAPHTITTPFSTHHNITPSLSQNSWYDWTAEQVQEWVQVTISKDPETIRIFRKHDIKGIDLALLGVSEYQSIGLRLGVACHVKRAVVELQRQDKTRSSQTHQFTSLGWLEQLDEQQRDMSSERTMQPFSMAPEEQDTPIPTDAVSAIFHERFGTSLELPQLANRHNSTTIGLVQRKKSLGTLASSPITQNGLRTDIPLVQNGLPVTNAPSSESALSFLPPHIRSIYQCNPQLVEHMISAQQQTNLSEEQRALLSQDEQDEEGDTENGGSYQSIHSTCID